MITEFIKGDSTLTGCGTWRFPSVIPVIKFVAHTKMVKRISR